MPRTTKTPPLKETVPQLGEAIRDSAQQIWLAGLGAFNKAQAEGSKAFEALVQEGVNLQRNTQMAAEEKMAEATQKVSSLASDLTARAGAPWERLESIFEERVAKALKRLGIPSVHDFETLMARLDKLDRKLDALSPTTAKAKRTTTRRPAAKVASTDAR